MKYLIRFITRNAAGGVEHSDKVVDAAVITIGRATDQVLHLKDRRARLQHAIIEQQVDGVHISTNALTGVVVNGRSQRSAKLTTGDVIEVGSNILRVIDAPDGIDFALTFELSADASTGHFVENWTAPVSGIGGWSKRRLSWALVAVVAVLAMALPSFAQHLQRHLGRALPGELARALQPSLRELPAQRIVGYHLRYGVSYGARVVRVH